ncbi:hypothetical protein [Paraburkholderia sp. Ac-20347]|uniref:hypothetical protein n=1 Tax=Paraburkholderia sp. Ac-20347 TaxID=2703892 RepID=UPI00198117D1|nr:hypothetical protein [Paraburkholderia sp. Ac-20347]MBN3809873.1 hypothetical protein [Paraburkholderia sp. Ac-20347]
MYDALEVLFFHPVGRRGSATLDALCHTLDGRFEIVEHEFLDVSRQVIRITATSEVFDSAYAFDEHLRVLANEDTFAWKVIGVVPVGQTETELV